MGNTWARYRSTFASNGCEGGGRICGAVSEVKIETYHLVLIIIVDISVANGPSRSSLFLFLSFLLVDIPDTSSVYLAKCLIRQKLGLVHNFGISRYINVYFPVLLGVTGCVSVPSLIVQDLHLIAGCNGLVVVATLASVVLNSTRGHTADHI